MFFLTFEILKMPGESFIKCQLKRHKGYSPLLTYYCFQQ